jgi:hypothetical protein
MLWPSAVSFQLEDMSSQTYEIVVVQKTYKMRGGKIYEVGQYYSDAELAKDAAARDADYQKTLVDKTKRQLELVRNYCSRIGLQTEILPQKEVVEGKPRTIFYRNHTAAVFGLSYAQCVDSFMHELAHYQVSSPQRRNKLDYGLLEIINPTNHRDEELRALALTDIWSQALLGYGWVVDVDFFVEEQKCTFTPFTATTTNKESDRAYDWLLEVGLVDHNLNPVFTVNKEEDVYE